MRKIPMKKVLTTPATNQQSKLTTKTVATQRFFCLVDFIDEDILLCYNKNMNKMAIQKVKNVVILTMVLVFLMAILVAVVHEQHCHGDNCQVCTLTQSNKWFLLASACVVLLFIKILFKLFNLKNNFNFSFLLSLVSLKTKLTD